MRRAFASPGGGGAVGALIAADVLGLDWMQHLAPSTPTLLIASGPFQYFRGPSSPRRALLGRRLALCTRVAMAVADRYLRARGHRSPQAPAPRALRTGQKMVPMIVLNEQIDILAPFERLSAWSPPLRLRQDREVARIILGGRRPPGGCRFSPTTEELGLRTSLTGAVKELRATGGC